MKKSILLSILFSFIIISAPAMESNNKPHFTQDYCDKHCSPFEYFYQAYVTMCYYFYKSGNNFPNFKTFSHHFKKKAE